MNYEKILLAMLLLIVWGTQANAEENLIDEKVIAKRNKDCVRRCGVGYYYDRPGHFLDGKELVCTKYPLPCGYNCTVGWDIKPLVHGGKYTCQKARQDVSVRKK